jgi:hypothetical protein
MNLFIKDILVLAGLGLWMVVVPGLLLSTTFSPGANTKPWARRLNMALVVVVCAELFFYHYSAWVDRFRWMRSDLGWGIRLSKCPC